MNFTYANADMLKSQSMPYSGDLPASENEIVVQESFLDSLGSVSYTHLDVYKRQS